MSTLLTGSDSRVGLGCYAASGAYGAFSEDSFASLIGEAFETGVSLFDTADQYGDAERILGRAVAPFRDQVIVATKVGLRPDGSRDCSPDHVITSCEQSLRRMNTEYIDLYQVHFDDPGTPVADTVGALELLQSQGKILHYGVGHLPVQRVQEYLEWGNPVSALCELSCLNYRQYTSLSRLSHSLKIVGFSPTARGLLTGSVGPESCFKDGDIRALDPAFRGARGESARRVASHLRDLACTLDATPAQLAIRWAMEQPGVRAVLTGTTSSKHLKENLGAQQIGWDDDIQRSIGDVLDGEERRLRKMLWEEICSIARGDPVTGDTIVDLVYALDSAVTFGWAKEEQVVPLFLEVWTSRRGGADEEILEHIRKRVRELLSIT